MLKRLKRFISNQIRYRSSRELGFKNSNSFDSLFDNELLHKEDVVWRNNYPISYLIHRIIRPAVGQIKRIINTIYWWIRYHTINRYHYLCLSQPDTRNGTMDHYDVGWIDSDQKIVFAMFNIMVDFVENELQCNFSKMEEYDSNGRICNKEYNEFMDELKAVYEYWTIIRLNQLIEIRDFWDDNPKRLPKETDDRYSRFNELKEDFYALETEMMIRLVNIRRGMWT